MALSQREIVQKSEKQATLSQWEMSKKREKLPELLGERSKASKRPLDHKSDGNDAAASREPIRHKEVR